MRTIRTSLRRGRDPLLGILLLSSIGSCELPKPQLPSIGTTPPGSHAAVIAGVMAPPTIREAARSGRVELTGT